MPSRRRTLVALFGLLAGCGSQSQSAPSPTPQASTASPPTTERGAGSSTPSNQSARSILVVNDGSDDRYVTVVVERETETVFVDSQTVRGGTSRRFEAVVAEAGTYQVLVETAQGTRGRFDWSVTDIDDDLRIELRTDVSFSRVVRCDPDCRGVSLGGSATGYPEGGFDPRGRRAGSTLRVQNPTERPRTVGVRVAEGVVLDYRYRVPPATTLEIPVPQRSGETRVDIGLPDGRETYQWSMEASPLLDIAVGSTVQFTCGEQSRDLRLLNDDDATHRLTVEVTTRGDEREPVFTETYTLGPGERLGEVAAVPTAGEYRLVVSTAESSASYEWSTCPSRGPVYVVVQGDGTVVARLFPL